MQKKIPLAVFVFHLRLPIWPCSLLPFSKSCFSLWLYSVRFQVIFWLVWGIGLVWQSIHCFTYLLFGIGVFSNHTILFHICWHRSVSTLSAFHNRHFISTWYLTAGPLHFALCFLLRSPVVYSLSKCFCLSMSHKELALPPGTGLRCEWSLANRM